MDRFVRVLSPNRSKVTSNQDSARTYARRPFHARSDLEMHVSDADTLDPVRRPRAHFEDITGYLELDLTGGEDLHRYRCWPVSDAPPDRAG